MNIYIGDRVQSKLVLLKDMYFEVEKIFRVDIDGDRKTFTEVRKADEDKKKRYVFQLKGGYRANGNEITVAPFRGTKK